MFKRVKKTKRKQESGRYIRLYKNIRTFNEFNSGKK